MPYSSKWERLFAGMTKIEISLERLGKEAQAASQSLREFKVIGTNLIEQHERPIDMECGKE